MELSLFVVSDLHAFDGTSKQSSAPSFFDISKPEGTGENNPIRDLKELINKPGSNLTADYLVCCGDLGDRAVPSATERAWKELNQIKSFLKAKQLVTTVGNHDVDSRYHHNDHDARGLLLDLSPGFPFEDESKNCQFWTHHFITLRDEMTNARFVVINSSAYHGQANDEYDHGRVSDRTRRRLKAALDREKRPSLNVLICHHHPQKHSELKLGDYDDMKGGYDLLSLINAADYGPWIIFHGHKHHPKISYAQGGSSSPVVFSAGSCSAMLSPELLGTARNQVYLIKLIITSEMTTNCIGEFVSWDWSPGRGWDKSQHGSGLPAKGGFGYRGDLGSLAQTVASKYPQGARWNVLLSECPDIRYLIPADTAQLSALLKNQYSYRFEDGKDGSPVLFEK